MDADQLNSCLDREVEEFSWKWTVGASTNRDVNDIPELPYTTQVYLDHHHDYLQDHNDMCFAYEGTTKIFSVEPDYEVIEAFSVKKLWRLEDYEPDGMEFVMEPSGITADGRGHLFICDTANNCIQIFDTDGTYLCPVNCNGEVKLGTPDRVAWSKTESALVVAHSVTDRVLEKVICRRLFSVLKIQIQPN